jgi:ureidoglycolate hydrolase
MTAGDGPARQVGRVIRRIKVEPMEPDTFNPFGTLIHAGGRPPDFRGGGQSVGWAVPFESDGRPQVTVVTSPFQGLRFGKLERHFGVTQAFIPFGGSPAVVAVAAPAPHPDRDLVPRPEDVRAFLIDDRKGYLLKRGTWHALDRFPLHPPTRCSSC